MAEKEIDPKVLSGEEALALARKGTDAWNAWAVEHEGQKVDFSETDFTTDKNKAISFTGFTFPGDVQFWGATFCDAGFNEATFEGDARFTFATFKEGAWFRGATVRGTADFSRVIIEGNAQFSEATFVGNAAFFRATFEEDVRFDEAAFEGDAGFSEVTFKEFAWFHRAKFGGNANFDRSVFEEDAGFQKAMFNGCARFLGATFEKHVGLGEAMFEGPVSFLGGTFLGSISLDCSRFKAVPDFRRTELRKHVTFYLMDVSSTYPLNPDDADKYRRLKELAVTARDHDREQEFFASELMAKRGHETRGWLLLPNYLYEWTSDFGRSLTRPVLSLVYTWFIFGCVFSPAFARAGPDITALHYSLANLAPFLPGTRARLKFLEDRLFNGDIPDAIFTLTAIEGTLALVFLFLLVLALRNRFRI